MIVATRPLIDCCPVVPAAMEGRQLVQWDKDSCADAGFLKIDLLGLGMLSAVERCVESIARTRGERIDLSRIPFDDPATFAAIAAPRRPASSRSRAARRCSRCGAPAPRTSRSWRCRSRSSARADPGRAVNPYIERRQRLREDPTYEPPLPAPSLAEVLRETLGTIIFQDQVLEVAQAFAGFGPGEADGLRRAMSRKRASDRDRALPPPLHRGRRAHVGAGRRSWRSGSGRWSRASPGFGFPKAHSAAFGLLAYQSTWLRVHYGPEFLCALLNEQPMGFYPPDSLAHEAQRRGIAAARRRRSTPRSRNARSRPRLTKAGGAVRIGLGYVRGVHAEEVAALVRARERAGRSQRRRTGRARSRSAALARAARLVGSLRRAGRRASPRAVGTRRRDPGRRVPGGTQLALALDAGRLRRQLRELGRWERCSPTTPPAASR
jgi:error-prone DNA polymerase